MVRETIIILISLFYCCCPFCQLSNPAVNYEITNRIITPTNTFDWNRVGTERDINLSPDGKYATWSFCYGQKTVFRLASTIGDWKNDTSASPGGFFNIISTYYISGFGDFFSMIRLGKTEIRKFYRVEKWCRDELGRWLVWKYKDSTHITIKNLITGYEIKHDSVDDFSFDDSRQWLLCRRGREGKDLLIYNLLTGKKKFYYNIQSYQFSSSSKKVLLVEKDQNGLVLRLEDIDNGNCFIIHHLTSVQEMVSCSFDSTGIEAAFVLKNKESNDCSYWYYKTGDVNAVKLVDNKTPGINPELEISGSVKFVGDNRYLSFMLVKPADKRIPTKESVKVDVWSSKDETFYTAQQGRTTEKLYPAVVSKNGGPVVQLVNCEREYLEGQLHGDYGIISKRETGDRFWEYRRDSFWLISLKDGSRTLLPFIKSPWLELDAAGKAVVAFDTYRGRQYYRYDIVTGKELKISANVPDWTLGIEHPYMIGWEEPEKWVNHEIAARTFDRKAIVVYDNYDLWKIDLTGKTPALNITNGFGRNHKLVFRLSAEKALNDNDELILTAFSEKNKDNGFYRKRFSQKGDPDSLFMGAYFFAHDRKIKGNLMPNPYGTGMLPIKATNTNRWIIRRESATEAPGYFFTINFKEFKPLTHLQPQKQYNWYTTELVNYTQENGIKSQGVLFKPKNFDPQKKYPVLFYYYEQYSSILNNFIQPAVSEAGKPNIPWYVSRGYLVFTPDNYFEKGWRFRSVLYSVEGAARELQKYSYVDGQRMGIIGLSQGGGFTNYILTHSHLFAAAFEGCGVSDNISAALELAQLNGEGGSRLDRSEALNGTNMWENPKQWVDESPVLNAHKVTTPLLIMHNKADGAVLFEQGIEIFTALRRWNKKVWLLQYDEGGHGVGGKDALDLTTRMTQYFGHYLKGAPPPRWMTSGIPSYLKGIETRYELDPDGFCGKDCKICIEKKY